LGCTVVMLLLLIGPRLARADVVGTQPAANAVVSSTPQRVSVPVTGAARGVTITVLASDHRQVLSEPAVVSGGRAVATLPTSLKPGVYTVVWQAPGAHPATGTFAFSVSQGATATPALVNDASPPAALNPLWQGLPRFFAFAFEMAMIGALALRLLVTRGAVRRYGERALSSAAVIDRRLLQTAMVSAVLFIPAYLSQLVVESADPDVSRGFWAMIRPGDIWTYLTTTGDGHVWEARLILTLVAAALLLPAGLATWRRGWSAASVRDERIMALAFVAGILELLARVVPTKTPPAWPREIFTQVLDFGHLVGASIWVGGLIGLAVLAVSARSITREAPALWSAVLRRFSLVATICVADMILTGLWTYWLHVGPPRLLFHTLYGETLLLKLVLVLALLGLGAINQLWLIPRVQALRASGATGSSLALAVRHFRVVLTIEATLGLAILFIVPQLAGSARNQSFQDAGGGLTAVAPAGSTQVSLRRSGLEPGITDYDLTVPGSGSRRVEVTFASSADRIPPTTVTAVQTAEDHYRVTGLYTPLTGDWQATVRVAGRPAVTLALPVGAAPAPPAKALPPSITASTWIWGIGWVLVVLLALFGAGLASRDQTQRRSRALAMTS
jgi:putative copper export protein/methionine-rich copper-binding protein CopC